MKVFLSSTYLDLIEHRKAVVNALRTMGEEVGHMEIFGARHEEPTKASLEELDLCDVMVGMYAYRYGTVPKGSKASVTEQEYLHASSKHLPILVFVVNPDHDWLPKNMDESLSKIKKFKAKASSEHTPAYFTTPDNLASQVVAAVGKLAKRSKTKKGSKSSAKHSKLRDTKSKESVRGVRDGVLGSTLPNQPYFFGREKELAIIADAISPESRTWGALIDGPGGIGKTALAIRAAHLAPANLFERKIFITAKVRELTPEGEQLLMDFSQDNYFSMLNELALELGEDGIPRLAPDERANPLRMAMAGKKTLIVFDNLETLSEDERTRLFQFLSRLPEGNKAIATSRRGRRDSDARTIRLDRMQRDEALQLIKKLRETSPRLARESEEQYHKLYEVTNGNPLLIKWVCGQLGREGSAMHAIVEACQFIEKSPEGNDPLEYIFGDLLETLNESEIKILAALTHFNQPAKLRWIAEMANLSEQAAETVLDDLTDRSILISNEHTEEFFLPSLAATFFSKKRSKAVGETAVRLTTYVAKIAAQHGKSSDISSLSVLGDEWSLIFSAWPLFLSGENTQLQDLQDSLDRFLDFSGRWDERLAISLQAEKGAYINKDFLTASLRALQASKIYEQREELEELNKCFDRAAKYLSKIKSKNAELTVKFVRFFRPPVLVLSRILADKEMLRLYVDIYDQYLSWWRMEPETQSKASSKVKGANKSKLTANKPRSTYISILRRKTINALKLAKHLNDKDAIAILTGNIAKIYVSNKQWAKAEPVAWEALKFAQDIGNQELIAGSCMCLALVVVTKNLRKSIEFAVRAVEIFQRLHHGELQVAEEVLQMVKEIQAEQNSQSKKRKTSK